MGVQDEISRLTDTYASEYMEKVFYFCLKKTGNASDAEELLSDISFNVISSFNNGSVPDNFPAYIWKTARNRYAVWMDRKCRRDSSVAPLDVGDYEITDESESREDEVIREEQLSLLRRELAFISSEYRDIVASHYIKGIKTSELAASLNLPKGTVLTKLARARKILKEGMNMAREFGKRSYDPEKLDFTASGSQPSGLPWRAIERSMSVNILCEANNNPCTVQELALELGVAVPYMEEEVKLLEQNELLKKLDNGKYITGFFIAPRECINEINELACTFAEKHYRKIWSLAEKTLDAAPTLGIQNGPYSVNEAQMFFAFFWENTFAFRVSTVSIGDYYKRSDGGSWGLVGFETGSECRLPQASFSNNVSETEGLDGKEISWWGYQNHNAQDGILTEERHEGDTVGCYDLMIVKDIAEGKTDDEFLDGEKAVIKKLTDKRFLIRRENGGYEVNAVTMKGSTLERLCDFIESLPEFEEILRDYETYLVDTKRIIRKYMSPFLEEDADYYVAMMGLQQRDIFARLWKDNGLYQGNSSQFCCLKIG